MRREDHNPASIILQRLQAEEALKEWKRKKVRPRIAGNVRAVWSQRAFLVRLSGLGFLLGAVIAFIVPVRYTSTARLMPPDNRSGSSLAVAASLAASQGTGGLGEIASDLLGAKGVSDVFVGILSSRTIQNQIINQFELRRIYGLRYMEDARLALASHVGISVDRKNQILSISVSDHSPQRAQAMAEAYIDQLNRLVTELSTSSARRERNFLEGRLQQVNQELETAEKEFSRFASKKGAIDIKEQGKAMVAAAATLQGQLMFARSELEGMRQIYTDSNSRVRALNARIAELQSQLEKFGGKAQANPPGSDIDAAAPYPSIRELPLLGVTYADLSRRTKVQEEIYEILTQDLTSTAKIYTRI
jgi:capsule polysaccharide export protein KpsE/RkpR